MFFGCVGVLIAASGFLTRVPPELSARLVPTNETSGTFVQVKRLPSGKAFESKGVFRVRPGVDLTWRTQEPFESLFVATQAEYVYSNEDEVVTKPLKDLPGYQGLVAARKGDFSMFILAFDTLYKAEGDEFHLLSKPKLPQLKRRLERVEIDGDATNFTMKATLPSKTTLTVTVRDDTGGLTSGGRF